MPKKKRVFTFPGGMPPDAQLIAHMLSSLGSLVGKTAPATMHDARGEVVVTTDDGTYRAVSFIEEDGGAS